MEPGMNIRINLIILIIALSDLGNFNISLAVEQWHKQSKRTTWAIDQQGSVSHIMFYQSEGRATWAVQRATWALPTIAQM